VFKAKATASSVDLFGLYANWSGSNAGDRQDVMWSLTNLSKHFITTEVSATGR